MIIHKNLIVFRTAYLNTKEGKGQNRRRSRQCRKLKKTIRKKFEHDDKALEYLQEHQYDCIENW